MFPSTSKSAALILSPGPAPRARCLMAYAISVSHQQATPKVDQRASTSQARNAFRLGPDHSPKFSRKGALVRAFWCYEPRPQPRLHRDRHHRLFRGRDKGAPGAVRFPLPVHDVDIHRPRGSWFPPGSAGKSSRLGIFRPGARVPIYSHRNAPPQPHGGPSRDVRPEPARRLGWWALPVVPSCGGADMSAA